MHLNDTLQQNKVSVTGIPHRAAMQPLSRPLEKASLPATYCQMHKCSLWAAARQHSSISLGEGGGGWEEEGVLIFATVQWKRASAEPPQLHAAAVGSGGRAKMVPQVGR